MPSHPRCLLFCFVLLVVLTGGCKPERRPVIVMCAASLARVLDELEEGLERKHPSLDVQLEISGSQEACRKVSELGRRADVVASADDRIIERLLFPGGHARFVLQPCTNELVLAHLEHSRHTEEVTPRNWPEVLLRPGVRLGLVDPDLAPIGFRTLLLWHLAELESPQDPARKDLAGRLRASVPASQVVPHELELLAQLQARSLDYVFMYRSTAEEHNLKVTRLPDEINLGSSALDRAYARAAVPVRLQSQKPAVLVQGASVTYGVTIPTGAPNPDGALLLLRELLGEPGRKAFRRTGFRPLIPARTRQPHALPIALRDLVSPEFTEEKK